MIVYLVTNNANGKEYVGLTSGTLARRRKEHFQSSASGSMTAFHCALRKYGADAFSWITLYSGTDRADICQKEIEEIASRKPAYNMTAGGDGIPAGFRHSRASMQGRSAAVAKVWASHTEEERAARGRAISAAKKGKPRPAGAGVKKGFVRSQEFKDKVAAGMRASRARRKALALHGVKP